MMPHCNDRQGQLPHSILSREGPAAAWQRQAGPADGSHLALEFGMGRGASRSVHGNGCRRSVGSPGYVDNVDVVAIPILEPDNR